MDAGVSMPSETVKATEQGEPSRKGAEEGERALGELAERLELSWAGNLGRWYWDVRSGEVDANPRKLRALGWEPGERAWKVYDFTELIHPEDHERTMRAMRDHLAGLAPAYEAEYRIRRRDGAWKWFYDRGYVAERDAHGAPLMVAGIVFDVTERKENELALERLVAEKDRFMSIIAHDLRNPFTVVVSGAELLERYVDELEPERVKELAGQVASQARRTAGLLEDILSWARSQTGGLAPAPTDFLVVELLDEIVSLYARPAGERRIGLEVECPSELRARADRSMVATVLRNLCSNAVRHIAAGGSVRLSARATDTGVEVEVSDTGPGMDAETLRSVLETGAARRRSATAGSGLGLALAREFASRAGGGLVIESSPEAGSRISVTLAAAPVD